MMKLAIVHDAFFDESPEATLLARLKEACSQGASIAVLSELALNKWMAVSQEFDVANAEELGCGPRFHCLQRCARAAGIAVIGGAITYQPGSDPEEIDVTQCESTTWLIDGNGDVLLQYSKVHLPHEAGYWEASHYSPSENLPTVVQFDDPRAGPDQPPWTIGIQLCSDIMRPAGAAYLASQGIQLLLHPRATPLSSYEKRWKPVGRACAITSSAYVVSVNRPSTGQPDTPCGGSSFAVSPGGELLCETTEPLCIVSLSMEEVNNARKNYPGYMQFAPQLLPKTHEP